MPIWLQTNAYFQEPNSEKTNNGIHYKLQLLYSNGKCKFLYTAGIDLQVFYSANNKQIQWSRINLHLLNLVSFQMQYMANIWR